MPGKPLGTTIFPTARTTQRKWILTGLYLLLTFFATSPIFLRTQSEFDTVFIAYARMLAWGGDIYHEGTPYLYPPWMAFFSVPFSWLPHWLSRGAFGLLNMACLVAAVGAAWKLASIYRTGNKSSPWVFILGLLCSATFFLNCTSHQQMDVIIAGLVLLGCWVFFKGKEGTGGVLLGIAAAFKMTPLLFLPYFLYRAKPKAAISLAGAFLLCNFLPDLFFPPPLGQPRILAFVERQLLPMASPGFVPGTWASEIVYNQSLSGFAKRMVQTRIENTEGKWRIATLQSSEAASQVKKLFLLMVGACLLLGFYSLGWPGRRSVDFPLEASLVICGMLLLSPMSGLAHFGILVLPAFCLAFGTLQAGWKFGPWFLALPLLGGVFLNKDLSGEGIYTFLLWSGALTAATLSLFAGSCWSLIGKRKIQSVAVQVETRGSQAA
ncbi:MAG: DUF2029 domain-containing protein [Gemmataceae bacterium]|nr:DUF2029 domain-containing protein [Gemmataceae bacterium]